MTIQKVLSECNSYKDLCTLAELSKPKLSFWGSQYIIVDGYEGTLEINDITKRLFELVKKDYDFNEEERAFGKRIASRINYIYDDIDVQIRASNLFTRIIAFIRGLTLYDTPREYWKIHYENMTFDLYTQSQFREVFGYSTDEAEKKGFKLGTLDGSFKRWFIEKAPIRA